MPGKAPLLRPPALLRCFAASGAASRAARQKPRGTIASMGHASRAAAARAGDTAAANPAASWKMKKFANVQSKVGRQG